MELVLTHATSVFVLMPCRALEAFRPCKTLWEFHPLQILSARLCVRILHPFPDSVNPGMEQTLHFKVSCEHPPPEGPQSGSRKGGVRNPAPASIDAGIHPRRRRRTPFAPFASFAPFVPFKLLKCAARCASTRATGQPPLHFHR